MRKRATRVLIALPIAGAALILGACGDSPLPKGDYVATLSESISTNSAVYDVYPESVSASLPNVEYDVGSDTNVRVTRLVATGHFTEWEGRATDWGVSDTGKSVDWDSTAADTRTVSFTFSIDEVLLSAVEGATPSGEIGVEITFKGSADEAAGAAEDLLSRDRLVLFLQPATPDEDGPYRVSLQGALIGEVDAEGNITMPIVDAVARRGGESPAAGIESDISEVSEIVEAKPVIVKAH